MNPENQNSVSLNKFISETGLCSRREADKLIASGKVLLNGVVAQLGNRVSQGDEVRVLGKILGKKDPTEWVYLAFNKPVGVICTTDQMVKGNIIDYIQYPERIFPIGRLDKPSEGLILLTSDGDIVNKILRADNKHEKEYIVSVDKPITREFVHKMANGLPVLGKKTLPCVVEKLGTHTFKIILNQGLNRQIRRMCEYLDYNVTSLKRIRIMNIHLHPLKSGEWRLLQKREIDQLKKHLKHSKKTID